MTAARHLGYAHPGSAEGRTYRVGRLGASEIGIVLGLAPSSYGSRFALWHEKSGLLERVDEQTEPMTVGAYTEAAIRSWWRDQHPQAVINPAPGTYVSAERDWQLASPDGLIYRSDGLVAVLECKFAAWAHDWGEPGTAEIPAHYLAQVTQQMDVMGVDVAHVAVLFGGEARFAEYVVPRLDENVRIVRDAGAAFIDSLGDPSRRPEIDGEESTLSTVRRSHPDIDEATTVRLKPGVVGDYVAACDDLAAAEAEHRRAKAAVLDQMGSARIACDEHGRERLRRQRGARNTVALHQIRDRKAPDNGTLAGARKAR